MTFTYSIIIASLFIGVFRNQLKERPVLFYVISIIVSFLAVVMVWSGGKWPPLVAEFVIPVFARGGLAGAFFVIVMMTGALPNKTSLIKILMPVRGELSIIASILTLGHNMAYGKTYFVALLCNSSQMPVAQRLAAYCSLAMILLMLPLFITSFKTVRRKMKGKNWKQLQRTAYLFYALLAAHIMLLCIPNALKGREGYILTVAVYGTIFVSYFICRILKAFKINGRIGLKYIDAVCVLLVAICMISAAAVIRRNNTLELSATKSTSAEEGNAETFDGMLARLEDGKYIGKALGNNDYITVEVEIISNTIVSVNVLEQTEDEEYWSDAVAVIQDITSCNSVQVDAVSGATYSSEGIKEAVRRAVEGGYNLQ